LLRAIVRQELFALPLFAFSSEPLGPLSVLKEIKYKNHRWVDSLDTPLSIPEWINQTQLSVR